MTEIQGKSILVRVSARFALSGVDRTSLCTSLTIVNVAFSRSAVVRCFSISAFLSLRYWRYALNFSSQATFRWSTVQDEYFTSNSCNFSGRVRVNIALSSFSSRSSSGRASISKHGQSSSGFIRKAGPLNHLSLVSNRCAQMPRDASSAGLRLPGQCLHWQGWEASLISATLLATYVLNLRVSLLMYCSVIFESVQKNEVDITRSISFRIRWCILTAIVAACNSSLGTDTNCRGAVDSWPW